MNISDALKTIYNELVHSYQFELAEMGHVPKTDRGRTFQLEKKRETYTTQLSRLSEIALRAGDPEMGAAIHHAALSLGVDAMPPAPM